VRVPLDLPMRALSMAPAAPTDLRSRLTAPQEEAAARRRGSLLLAAGAGSGKTLVLVERFVRAVCEDGVAPGRILAITFTERAAAELRGRVRARLLELGEREAARDTERALIGTFHGFCARLLRTHALSAGLDPDFAILDEAGAGRLALLAFRRSLASLLASERREQAIDLLAAYGAERVQGIVLGVYAEQRSLGASLPSLPQPAPSEPPEEEALRACALLGAALEEFGRGYTELKRARSALDFDDLELCARELLAHNEGVRDVWAERLELLMVDEFQDTNRRQLALLELLERGNLFTVGDELQSIYGFRHAEVEIFRARRRALGAEGAAIALTHNFRSRPPLIAAVNSVFGERFGDAYTPLIAAREEGREDAPSIELLLTDRRGWDRSSWAQAVAGALPPATLWRQAEARLLAQRVAELVQGGTAAGDVVVLLRAAGDLPVYERALEERGLRTLAAVGSFWGHQQVGDLLMWLRALANPLDELALYSVLASPLVGLSSDGLALLALHARAAGLDAWAAITGAGGVGVGGPSGEGAGGVAAERDGGGGLVVEGVVGRAATEGARAGEEGARGAAPEGELYGRLSTRDRERLERFAVRFAAERRVCSTHPIAELLLRAIALEDPRSVSYEQHVLSLVWGERRLANIHKLLRLARRFEAAEGRDLRGFLDHVEHSRTLSEGAEPHAPTGSEPDAVRLMTIHAAKGLEFPVVCLADLGRALNGTPPELLVDGERIGLRLASLDGSPSVACLRYEELWEERRRAQAAEEERIVYVAMTRARERLLLSGSCDFDRLSAARPPCGDPIPRGGDPIRRGGDPIAAGEAPIAGGLPPSERGSHPPLSHHAPGGGPINWLAPALAPELPALARTLERPVAELAVGGEGARLGPPHAGGRPVGVRCWLNAPATVGKVLREDSLSPRAGAAMLVG
jgi:ATP-dependent exoDNAse (exonuclease V) beta subunit